MIFKIIKEQTIETTSFVNAKDINEASYLANHKQILTCQPKISTNIKVEVYKKGQSR